MNDDDVGDTYMRSSDGIVSREFAELRLPYGTGLGGLVAQHGHAEWTPNYLADEHIVHVRYMDEAIARSDPCGS